MRRLLFIWLVAVIPVWSAPGAAGGAHSGATAHSAGTGAHTGSHARARSSYHTSSYYYGGGNLDPKLRRQGYRSTGYGYSGAPSAARTPKPKRSLTLDQGHPKGYTDHVQR